MTYSGMLTDGLHSSGISGAHLLERYSIEAIDYSELSALKPRQDPYEQPKTEDYA